MQRLLSGAAQRAAIFVVVATLTLIPTASVDGATLHGKREAHSEETADGEIKICDKGDPCGWALYNAFTRKIDYFVENACRCANGMECRNTDTDKYLKAYVYRCTQVNRPQTSGAQQPPRT